MNRKTCDHCIATMDKMYRQAMRSLWLARAMRAQEMADRIWEVNLLYLVSNPKDYLAYQIFEKWQWAEHKCREKAKEFE